MNARILAVEVRDEIRILVRQPTAAFFLVLMPVGFFALFAGMWGADEFSGMPVGTSLLATFGTFGVVGVMLMHPGIGVSEDRERGWLRAKRAAAVPVWVALAGKVIATVPVAVAILAAMTAAAAAFGTLDVAAGSWVRLVGILLVGGVPFALLGLAVGFVSSSQTTTAVLNAFLIPAAVVSGLWMPIETLPELLQTVAPALPTYHLAQLALAQLGTPGWAGHAVTLVGWSVLAGVLAVLAYARSRP